MQRRAYTKPISIIKSQLHFNPISSAPNEKIIHSTYTLHSSSLSYAPARGSDDRAKTKRKGKTVADVLTLCAAHRRDSLPRCAGRPQPQYYKG